MEAKKIQSVIKIGDSLAVVLPKYLTRELGIERGDAVMIACKDERVISVVRVAEHELRRRRLDLIPNL